MMRILRPVKVALGFGAALLSIVAASLAMVGCSALLPTKVSTLDRVTAFPTSNIEGLTFPVNVYWNDFQVPFIEAQSDEDLAFVLGMVHLHLREGQMMVLKRVAEGRLAEMAGPIATEIDFALRIVGLNRAVPEIEAQLPPETARFLQSFVAGLNFYQKRSQEVPPELGLLGLDRETWTVRDVLSISRLAGADVNWFIFASLLAADNQEAAAATWQRILEGGNEAVTSFNADSSDAENLSAILAHNSRSGSNAIVVSGSKTKSGKPMIANDPHLGLRLPNFWLLAGFKSPSYHAVGMMIPGVPILGVGRNECLAWGGTNMRAASSDLYDVSELAADEFTETPVTLAQRFWLSSARSVRLSPFGPVISDSEMFSAPSKKAVALRWVGHTVTDEVSAFLRASKACTAEEFREALFTFGVSGQNMLFATSSGDIGQVHAAILPSRPEGFPAEGPVRRRDDRLSRWDAMLDSRTLPVALNPQSGFIASANNKPTEALPIVGFAFSANDRILRLKELLSDAEQIDMPFLAALQRDVKSNAALAIAQVISRESYELALSPQQQSVLHKIQSWNGEYEATSAGALAFELVFSDLITTGFTRMLSAEVAAAHQQWNYTERNFEKDFTAVEKSKRREILLEAIDRARTTMTRYHSWGDIHRLSVGHVLSAIPVLGTFFVEADLPISGSRETIMKTAHGAVTTRHAAQYGSQSRHISDLSDPDSNFFVLLGGQDGWLGSANFADQLSLWQQGEYIQIPLLLESAQRLFKHRSELGPTAKVSSKPKGQ